MSILVVVVKEGMVVEEIADKVGIGGC